MIMIWYVCSLGKIWNLTKHFVFSTLASRSSTSGFTKTKHWLLWMMNHESDFRRYKKLLGLLFLFANCFPWRWYLSRFFTMSSHERFEQLNFKFFRVNPFKAQNQICWEQKELEKYLSQRERIGEASRIHLKTNPPHHHRLLLKALFIIQTSQAEKGKVSLDEFRRLVASRSFL